MAFTAQKGHAHRVLEYHARRTGIVLAPFNDADLDGWRYPLIDGERTRTARSPGHVSTPYAVLSTPNPQTPLRATHPNTIGNPGNERPHGHMHWINDVDPTISISWDGNQDVYMRGFKVFTTLAVRACSVYKGTVLVATETEVYTCKVADMVFDGTAEALAANDALLTLRISYSDPNLVQNPLGNSEALGGSYGFYISPLGSVVVLLTKVRSLTLTISDEGGVSVATENQPTPPDLTNVGPLSYIDTYENVVTDIVTEWHESDPPGNPVLVQVEHTNNPTGGSSATANFDIEYTYQYGVVWAGETPQPVHMNILRHWDFEYTQVAEGHERVYSVDGKEQWANGGYVGTVEYSETSTNTITGMGDPIVVYTRNQTHARNWTQSLQPWVARPLNEPGDDPIAFNDFALTINNTDIVTGSNDVIRSSDGRVVVTVNYENSGAFAVVGGSGTYSWDPNDFGVEVVPSPETFPNFRSIGWQNPSASAVHTTTGTREYSVTIDGNLWVLPIDTPDVVEVLSNSAFAPARIDKFYTAAQFVNLGEVDGHVSWNENLFSPGFLRSFNKVLGDFRYATYNGKSVVAADPDISDEHEFLQRIFASDTSTPYDLLDIPSDAKAPWVSVI